MTDPLLPKPVRDLVPIEDYVNAPLDPKVLAQIRRERGDKAQLDWDSTRMPAEMLAALVSERGADPAILIPPARFMETMTNLLTDRGGQLDPAILQGVVRTCSRKLVQGSFREVALYLRHAWGGIKADGTSDELLAACVRELFPVAPGTWLPSMGTGRTLLGSRRRLPMQNMPIPTKQAINLPPKDDR